MAAEGSKRLSLGIPSSPVIPGNPRSTSAASHGRDSSRVSASSNEP